MRNRSQKLLDNFQHRAVVVTRGRAGKQGTNGLNGLPISSNDPAHISLPHLETEDSRPPIRDFRKHHLIGELDELSDHEFKELLHRRKINGAFAIVDL